MKGLTFYSTVCLIFCETYENEFKMLPAAIYNHQVKVYAFDFKLPVCFFLGAALFSESVIKQIKKNHTLFLRFKTQS